MTTPEPNSFDAAVQEAHTLRAEPKAMKDSTFVSIFRARDGIYFVSRGNRADALRAEGFIEVARMDASGTVTSV